MLAIDVVLALDSWVAMALFEATPDMLAGPASVLARYMLGPAGVYMSELALEEALARAGPFPMRSFSFYWQKVIALAQPTPRLVRR